MDREDDLATNTASLLSMTDGQGPPPAVDRAAVVDLTGRQLAHFELRALLGAGGMGVVYRAQDQRLFREVALKVVAGAHDPVRTERFLREARSAAKVEHPNIATVYEIGSEGDFSYISMELIEGADLKTLLEHYGALETARVQQIAAAIAAGLACAHDAGIVHRDLKPHNVMITEDGRVKILDFGLAKTFDSVDDQGKKGQALTREGTIMGTPQYMSPEQADGQPLDARSDVFSFGVLLYELLSGRRPFDGDSMIDVLYRVKHQAPPPIEAIRPDLSGTLLEVMHRCLQKDPALRFASAREVHDALGAPKESVVSMAPARERRVSLRRRVVPLAIGAALVLALLLFGVHRWRRGPASEASIPVLSQQPAVQARFVAAVQLFYQGRSIASDSIVRSLPDAVAASPVALALRAVLAADGAAGEPAVLCGDATAALGEKASGRDADFVRLVCRALLTSTGAETAAFSRAHPRAFFHRLALASAQLPTTPLLTQLDDLAALDPSPLRTSLLRARIFELDAQRERADRELLSTGTDRDADAPRDVLRARLHARRGHLDAATAMIRAVLDRDPSDIDAHDALLEVLFAAGDEAGIEVELTALEQRANDPDTAIAFERHAARLAAAGRWRESITFIERAEQRALDTGRVDEAGLLLLHALRWEELLSWPHTSRSISQRVRLLQQNQPGLSPALRRMLATESTRIELMRAIDDGQLAKAEDLLTDLGRLHTGAFAPELGSARSLARAQALAAARRGDADKAMAALAVDGAGVGGLLDELGDLHTKAAVALALEDAEAAAHALEQLRHRGLQCDVVRSRERTECTLITTLALLSQAELADAADQDAVAQERLREAELVWPQPDDALLVAKRMHKLRERLR